MSKDFSKPDSGKELVIKVTLLFLDRYLANLSHLNEDILDHLGEKGEIIKILMFSNRIPP